MHEGDAFRLRENGRTPLAVSKHGWRKLGACARQMARLNARQSVLNDAPILGDWIEFFDMSQLTTTLKDTPDMSNGGKTKVLVISTFFAPSGVAGGKRFSFLSGILEKNGLDVYVLASKEDSRRHTDTSLPSSGKIYRTRSLLPFPISKDNFGKRLYRRIMTDVVGVVDPYLGWLPTAVIKGVRLVRREGVCVVVATAPPRTAVMVGAIICRLTGAKLILDYRDPWTAHYWPTRYQGMVSKGLNSWLERWVVRKASAIVFVTEVMLRNFKEILGKYAQGECAVITNGMSSIEQIQAVRLGGGTKNILYAGTFYGQRRLSLILGPLCDFFESGRIEKKDVRIHVFGEIPKDDWENVKVHGLEDIVEQHERVSHKEVLSYMKGADILLFFSGDDVNYALPFKVFDYLSAKKPILAIAPRESAVAEFMAEMDCGEMGVIDDAESIRSALSSVLEGNRSYLFQGLGRYYWESVGKEYAALIERLAANG